MSINPLDVIFKPLTMRGFWLGHPEVAAKIAPAIAQAAAMIASGRVHIPVAATYPPLLHQRRCRACATRRKDPSRRRRIIHLTSESSIRYSVGTPWRLEGKIAVITGANSGIALASAKRFVKEGAQVYITRHRQEELDKALQAIGAGVTAVQDDVSAARRRQVVDRRAETAAACPYVPLNRRRLPRANPPDLEISSSIGGSAADPSPLRALGHLRPFTTKAHRPHPPRHWKRWAADGIACRSKGVVGL
jgi:hypothetical protein